MITGYLRRVRIAQVPLQPIHPGLDRSELRFLVSNFLICALFAVVRFCGSIFQMLACLNFAPMRSTFRFLLLLLLFFGGEMQRDAANHFSLRIGELERCRSLAIVILRNVKENGCAKWRIITGIGWTSLVGIGKAVIMC